MKSYLQIRPEECRNRSFSSIKKRHGSLHGEDPPKSIPNVGNDELEKAGLDEFFTIIISPDEWYHFKRKIKIKNHFEIPL